MKVKVPSVVSDALWPHNCTDHGILQARILEWVAIPFSRGSSQLRGWTQVSHIAGGFFTSWATREAHTYVRLQNKTFAEAWVGWVAGEGWKAFQMQKEISWSLEAITSQNIPGRQGLSHAHNLFFPSRSDFSSLRTGHWRAGLWVSRGHAWISHNFSEEKQEINKDVYKKPRKASVMTQGHT